MLQNSHDTRRQADIAIDSGSDSVLYKILLASSDATLHNCIKARELAIVKLMYMYGGLSAVDDQLHVRVDRSLIWIIKA